MPSPYPPLNDPDWLRREYLEHRRTARAIAAEVGCPHGAVDRALRRNGIRRPPQRTQARLPRNWLKEQYEDSARSISEIAAELRVSEGVILHALQEAGIATSE